MDVSAEDEIGPGDRPRPQGGLVAAHQVGPVPRTGHRRGLMHHHHAQLLRTRRGQQACHTVDLRGRHFPVLVPPGARGVDPDDQQVRRRVNRLEVGAEHLGEARVRAGQARPEIEQGDVVVAGHRQDRRPQSVDEGLRRAELGGSRALRDVAREHHQVRPLLRCEGDQGLDHRRLLGAEVGVGDVKQDAHAAALMARPRACLPGQGPGAGTRACPARGSRWARASAPPHRRRPPRPPCDRAPAWASPPCG